MAVLLTRDVGDLGPSWGYFIVAGGAALLIAALVAWQMRRRMARTLVEAMEATGRIASGDLASRVPVRRGDYPEFASLAGSINDMAQSLEDGRARERQLLLSVSHDLRTPLTSIRGFAEAIQDGAIEDSAQAADVIIAESRRLERLVGDLLDLTKLEAQQMSIASARPTWPRWSPRRRRGSGLLRPRAGSPSWCEVPGHDGIARAALPLPVAADPDRLAQLLANLLENAMTFARTTVTVGLAEDPASGASVDHGRRRRPGIALGRPGAGVRTLLPGRPGAEPPDGIGARAGDRGRAGGGHGGTVRAESPVNDDGGSRFVVTLRQWQAAAPVPSTV